MEQQPEADRHRAESILPKEELIGKIFEFLGGKMYVIDRADDEHDIVYAHNIEDPKDVQAIPLESLLPPESNGLPRLIKSEDEE